MRAIRLAEFLATGSLSTRWFQGLFAGKIAQCDASASGCADTKPGAATSAPAISGATQATATARRRIGQETTAMPPGITPKSASSTAPR